MLVADFSRHVLKSADAVIAPSCKVGRLLERYGVSAPVSIIPSGIDLVRYSHNPSRRWIGAKQSALGLGDEELRLIFVGRLAKEKNVDELLELFERCRDLPVKMVIVGDGPVREKLEVHAKMLGITDKVIFTGMVNPAEVGEYYHIGDVFVNASTSETQGLTYVEAMAAGLPMLCKRDECLEGIVKDGVNGWQYGDDSDFRDHIITLLDNPELRKNMSVNASLEAQRFSTAVFVLNVEKLYMETIEKSRIAA